LDIPEKHRQAALTVFQNITDAWHILGDKAQREQYDREREGVYAWEYMCPYANSLVEAVSACEELLVVQ
jgi:curved DNA-binding protein CbpA